MTASEKMHSPELPYLRTTINHIVTELHNLRESTVRPSLTFYNTYTDIDRLAAAITCIQGRKNTF